MSAPLTRAELRARRERPLFTATFWVDLAERVITSAAGGVATVLALDGFDLLAADSWQALAVGAGVAALTSFVKGIAAAGTGTGSASLAPSV